MPVDGKTRRVPTPIPTEGFPEGTEVFVHPWTRDVFTNYDDYVKHHTTLMSRKWCCNSTGKEGLAFGEALASEVANEKAVLDSIPAQYRETALKLLHHNPRAELTAARYAHAYLSSYFSVGEGVSFDAYHPDSPKIAGIVTPGSVKEAHKKQKKYIAARESDIKELSDFRIASAARIKVVGDAAVEIAANEKGATLSNRAEKTVRIPVERKAAAAEKVKMIAMKKRHAASAKMKPAIPRTNNIKAVVKRCVNVSVEEFIRHNEENVSIATCEIPFKDSSMTVDAKTEDGDVVTVELSRIKIPVKKNTATIISETTCRRLLRACCHPMELPIKVWAVTSRFQEKAGISMDTKLPKYVTAKVGRFYAAIKAKADEVVAKEAARIQREEGKKERDRVRALQKVQDGVERAERFKREAEERAHKKAKDSAFVMAISDIMKGDAAVKKAESILTPEQIEAAKTTAVLKMFRSTRARSTRYPANDLETLHPELMVYDRSLYSSPLQDRNAAILEASRVIMKKRRIPFPFLPQLSSTLPNNNNINGSAPNSKREILVASEMSEEKKTEELLKLIDDDIKKEATFNILNETKMPPGGIPVAGVGGVSETSFGRMLSTYDFLQSFQRQLQLTPFTPQDFMEALAAVESGEETPQILVAVHLALTRFAPSTFLNMSLPVDDEGDVMSLAPAEVKVLGEGSGVESDYEMVVEEIEGDDEDSLETIYQEMPDSESEQEVVVVRQSTRRATRRSEKEASDAEKARVEAEKEDIEAEESSEVEAEVEVNNGSLHIPSSIPTEALSLPPMDPVSMRFMLSCRRVCRVVECWGEMDVDVLTTASIEEETSALGAAASVSSGYTKGLAAGFTDPNLASITKAHVEKAKSSGMDVEDDDDVVAHPSSNSGFPHAVRNVAVGAAVAAPPLNKIPAFERRVIRTIAGVICDELITRSQDLAIEMMREDDVDVGVDVDAKFPSLPHLSLNDVFKYKGSPKPHGLPHGPTMKKLVDAALFMTTSVGYKALPLDYRVVVLDFMTGVALTHPKLRGQIQRRRHNMNNKIHSHLKAEKVAAEALKVVEKVRDSAMKEHRAKRNHRNATNRRTAENQKAKAIATIKAEIANSDDESCDEEDPSMRLEARKRFENTIINLPRAASSAKLKEWEKEQDERKASRAAHKQMRMKRDANLIKLENSEIFLEEAGEDAILKAKEDLAQADYDVANAAHLATRRKVSGYKWKNSSTSTSLLGRDRYGTSYRSFAGNTSTGPTPSHLIDARTMGDRRTWFRSAGGFIVAERRVEVPEYAICQKEVVCSAMHARAAPLGSRLSTTHRPSEGLLPPPSASRAILSPSEPLTVMEAISAVEAPFVLQPSGESPMDFIPVDSKLPVDGAIISAISSLKEALASDASMKQADVLSKMCSSVMDGDEYSGSLLEWECPKGITHRVLGEKTQVVALVNNFLNLHGHQERQLADNLETCYAWLEEIFKNSNKMGVTPAMTARLLSGGKVSVEELYESHLSPSDKELKAIAAPSHPAPSLRPEGYIPHFKCYYNALRDNYDCQTVFKRGSKTPGLLSEE